MFCIGGVAQRKSGLKNMKWNFKMQKENNLNTPKNEVKAIGLRKKKKKMLNTVY